MIDSVYLLATTVAGRQFYDADDAWPYLSVGTTLAMRYEPENSHDRFAVSLWYEAEDKQYNSDIFRAATTSLLPLCL